MSCYSPSKYAVENVHGVGFIDFDSVYGSRMHLTGPTITIVRINKQTQTRTVMAKVVRLSSIIYLLFASNIPADEILPEMENS